MREQGETGGKGLGKPIRTIRKGLSRIRRVYQEKGGTDDQQVTEKTKLQAQTFNMTTLLWETEGEGKEQEKRETNNERRERGKKNGRFLSSCHENWKEGLNLEGGRGSYVRKGISQRPGNKGKGVSLYPEND